MTEETKLVSRANSKGLVENFFSSYTSNRKDNPWGYKPDFNLKVALSVVRNDPVVRGAIRSIVDKAMENGYHIKGTNKEDIKSISKKLKEIRFSSRLLRPLLNQIALNGNAFIEIIKANGEFKDLNLLEPQYVEIIADENGNIKGYFQGQIDPKVKAEPTWTPEQIVHVKMDNLSVNVWADVDIKPIYDAVVIKDFVRSFLDWLFRTNQYRSVFTGKNLSEGQIKQLISSWKASENDVTKPLPLEGEWEYKVLRDISEVEQLYKIMDWCDLQILMGLGVPPASAGRIDQSGRSNSDVQEGKKLPTRVKAIQSQIEDAITNDLFVKINYKSCEFLFDYIDGKTISDALEIAEKMRKNLGFKKEVVIKYLNDVGIDFGDIDDPFDEELEQLETKKSEDMFPSRKGKKEGEVSNHSEEKTTRPDQLVSRTESDPVKKFGEWPYTY